MQDVHVAGAAMTAFGKFPDSTLRSLAEEAVAGALDDAGLAPRDVQMAFFANATAGLLTGQEMIRGQSALRHTGLLGIPIVNVENACASATTAFTLACLAVGAGAVDVAIAVGAEKLTHPDKGRVFAAIGTAVDLLEPPRLDDGSRTDDAGGAPSPLATGASSSYFMEVYAAMARSYMARSGATAEDFAGVAVKNSRHGALNPKAQYGRELTVAEVLASRSISPPLTLLMCSPIGDGAAAVLVCSAQRARQLGAPVRVRASRLLSGTDRADGESGSVTRAATLAYEQAGIGPGDVDVIELHDGAAPAELMTYEDLGLCAHGDGPKLLASGDTALGGRVPVNISGGLLSRGHPIGATGCAQIVELVDQLRGRAGRRQVDGVQVALAENGGGYLENDSAAMTVTLLSV